MTSTAIEQGRIRGLRWYIIGMVCLLTIINYIDRMTLSEADLERVQRAKAEGARGPGAPAPARAEAAEVAG